jgi:hypothetical protein
MMCDVRTSAAVLGPFLVALLGLVAGAGCRAAEPSSAPAAGACPDAWAAAPHVDPSLVPPHGGVLLHGSATGTQSYACTAAADGGARWTFTGPRAELRDCHGELVARHFASDAGAAPEWQAPDGAYVIATKAAALTPDGGASAVPWLLLGARDHGGEGPLARTAYVQRVGTDGGVAPAGGCTPGATRDVPYGADYYFYGP